MWNENLIQSFLIFSLCSQKRWCWPTPSCHSLPVARSRGIFNSQEIFKTLHTSSWSKDVWQAVVAWSGLSRSSRRKRQTRTISMVFSRSWRWERPTRSTWSRTVLAVWCGRSSERSVSASADYINVVMIMLQQISCVDPWHWRRAQYRLDTSGGQQSQTISLCLEANKALTV